MGSTVVSTRGNVSY